MRTSDMKRLGEAWASVTSKKQQGYTEEEIRELCHSKDHNCAITVNHPEWGLGKPVYESHAIPTDDGFVEWYDVQFKHGIEERVPVADMEVIEESSHTKKDKKKTDEGNAFTAALQAAKEKGDDTFVVAGKKYDVKTEEARLAKEDASNDKSDDGDGLDKADPKAAKKKFKDRKDKDIDNDGDVDDSDEFLHKRRKAIGKAMAKDEENGEEENGGEEDGEEKKDMPKVAGKKDDKKKVASNAKTAEISKIGESTEQLIAMLETAAKQQKSNATKPEGMMDKESGKSKEFANAHNKSDKKMEDDVEDAKDKTTKAGQATKPKSGKRPQDNASGDTNVVKSTEAPVKEDTADELVAKAQDIISGKTMSEIAELGQKEKNPHDARTREARKFLERMAKRRGYVK
jgi:hypothetical protein